jgi:hypothetical protein
MRLVHKSAHPRRSHPRESSAGGITIFRGLLLTIIGVLTMSSQTKEEIASSDQYKEWREYRENFPALPWKAWGSWFSWGSPVGLGLFFIETAAAVWILTQAF